MITTLDEAIKHCHEKAEELKIKAEQNHYMAEENEMCEVAGSVSKYIHSVKEFKQIEADCLECAKEYEQLTEWLTELKERREADKWTPVSEGLPKEGNKSYLVTVDYGKGLKASCQRFFFNYEIGWNDDCVIAWKPLPEEYKGENT